MNDILAYTQAGAAHSATSVNLHHPLEMALLDFEKEIATAGATVTSGSLPTLRTNLSLVAFVFQNLVGNALKFRSDRPPRIQIGSQRDGGDWIISVGDNGEGFDSQYAEQIFLPFERLHSRNLPGSGIGLATCRRIVQRLGGRIWAESELGKGSTFYFTLPDV